MSTPPGLVLCHGNGCGQVRIDVFAVAGELGQLLLNGRLLLQTGLLDVPQGGTDHHVSEMLGALNERERAVAVQGGADERGSTRVAVEKHILPRDFHVVEDDQ